MDARDRSGRRTVAIADAWHHSVSSSRKWGGDPLEYIHIHNWFDDESKASTGDFRHRALRHHTTGILECIERFGHTITLTTGIKIPVRWIAEQHVVEDLGRLVSVGDWLRCIKPEPWMNRPQKLSKELERKQDVNNS